MSDDKPILDYRSAAVARDVEDVPEFDSIAEKLIDEGAGPAQLRRAFTDSRVALQYFAKSKTRRAEEAIANGLCEECGDETHSLHVVECEWFARIATDGYIGFQFITRHRLCDVCGSSTDRYINWNSWRHSITGALLTTLSTIAFWGSVMYAIFMTLLCIFFRMQPKGLSISLLAMIVCTFLWVLMNKTRPSFTRRAIPSGVEWIGMDVINAKVRSA